MNWHEDHDNVMRLARHLVDECYVFTTDELLRYFEKPWKYSAEWEHLNGTAHKASKCIVCQCEGVLP